MKHFPLSSASAFAIAIAIAFALMAGALLFMESPAVAAAPLHFSDDSPAPVATVDSQAQENQRRTAQIRDQHRAEREARRAAERASRTVPQAPLAGRGNVPESLRERIESNREKKFEARRRYREEQRALRCQRQAESQRIKDEVRRKKEDKARRLEEEHEQLAYDKWQAKLKVEHTQKKPAPEFVKRFAPYVLSLGSVSLLKDTVATVQAKHKGCTLIPNESSKTLGRLVCSHPQDFGADGEAAIFGYLIENDVIVTSDFFFREQRKLENRIKAILTQPPFKENFRAAIDSVRYEAPMYAVTQVENPVESLGKGAWLRIQARYLDELGPLDRLYAASGSRLDFGELVVGETRRDSLQNYSRTCRKVSADSITDFSEFYGQCFGFTEDAFYQLAWTPETNVLSQLTVTPVRVAIANLLDETLRAKYGEEAFCPSLDTDARVFNRTNRKTFKAATMYSPETFRKQTANVYLGACDEPYVFTTAMRYVFRTVDLGEERIAANYQERLHENEIQASIAHWRQDQLEKFKDMLTPRRDEEDSEKLPSPSGFKTPRPLHTPSKASVAAPRIVTPKTTASPQKKPAHEKTVQAMRPLEAVVPPTVRRLNPPKVVPPAL